MEILRNQIEKIGATPLIELMGLPKQQARIFVKPEGLNPGGSIKDRTALAMIEDAERRGMLTSGATIIEPTSGNTGIGLAWIGALKGYKVIIVMPDTMSKERQSLLRAYGAQVVLSPGKEGMQGAIKKAEELKLTLKTAPAVILSQFTNEANTRIHELTTGEEIWQDTAGQVDAVVAGVGTGGTLIGIARCLKKHKGVVQAIAVEPALSPVLKGGSAAAHGLQGIGANFVPPLYDPKVVDEVIDITDEQAIDFTRLLAQQYGILAGISSGAALAAAVQLAAQTQWKNKCIVVILPDSGERYLSVL